MGTEKAEKQEVISPELVLVDPELAARVRAAAVAGPPIELWARERAAPATSPSTAWTLDATVPDAVVPGLPVRDDGESTHREPERRVAWRDRLLSGLRPALVVLIVAGFLGAGFLPPRQAPQLGTASRIVETPPTLSWRSVGNVRYRVEIYASGRRVHKTTTRRTSFDVPRSLGPGRFTWSVFLYRKGKPSLRSKQPLERGWFINASSAG